MDSLDEAAVARRNALDAMVTVATIAERAQDHDDMLGAIRLVELAADQARRAVVAEARAAGTTWQELGDALGVTRQAAEARFGGRAATPVAHREDWLHQVNDGRPA